MVFSRMSQRDEPAADHSSSDKHHNEDDDFALWERGVPPSMTENGLNSRVHSWYMMWFPPKTLLIVLGVSQMYIYQSTLQKPQLYPLSCTDLFLSCCLFCFSHQNSH